MATAAGKTMTLISSTEETTENSKTGRRDKDQKRYNLVLPKELYEEVRQLADKRQTTVVDLLRRFIKLGLLATSIEEAPNSSLLVKENGVEREIILL